VFDRWKQARADEQELNLIPIMNLMMVLIPFLLLGAAFYHLGSIPTTLPSHRPEGGEAPEQSDVVVTLSLRIEETRLALTASAAELSEEALSAMGLELPLEDGAYDLEALQARLHDIKSRHPKSDTVVVLPADGVRYQLLVDVLDAARERVVPREGDEPLREALFPVTVFSRMIVAEGGEADGEEEGP
jgi:biopolymer transport protein ExbD